MTSYPKDIYTEPNPIDVNTLNNLGPLTRLAGVWEGTKGLDIKPKADGPRKQVFVEHIEIQPIDPQTNGPQLLYGLRYHTHITKPGQVKTYHDQLGYWLWEPATGTIIHTLTIPRGVNVLASGQATQDATSFEVNATLGSESSGISSAPFLQYAFDTIAFQLQITFQDDGSWSYMQDTVLKIAGQDEPFHHVDTNTLRKVADATPNPLALEADTK